MACYNEAPYDCTFDSGGGKEYDNIDTWEIDSSVDVSGLGVVLLSCYDGPHDQDVTVNGSTSENATHYRAIASAADCATPWAGKEGTGACFEITSGSGFVLQDAYSRLFNLGVKGTCNDATSHYALQVGVNCKAINVVQYESLNSGSGGYYGSYSQENGAFFFQCISIAVESRGFYINAGSGETIGIICCTAAENTGAAQVQSTGADGTVILWSCYADKGSATNAINESNWDSPSGWNCADDATADLGGTAGPYYNSHDLDGSMDADWLATASLDADDGDDHTGDGNCGRSPVNDLSATYNPDSFFTTPDPLFGYDIAGNARPSGTDAAWDVGASEYVVAGSTVPVKMHHYMHNI